MHRPPLAISACIALALGGAFATGCGSDNNKDSGSAAPAKTAPASSSESTGGTRAPSATDVEMKNIKFVPATISVKVGQKITWTNNDGFAHNVTSTAGEKIASDNIEGGKTFEFTPKKAGTIAYTCTLHANQEGTITVTK